MGRSVMQKLQEFRTRHELEWGYQAPKLKSLGRRERGEIILNQKSNAVADIAAVLAGAGRGSRMWSRDPVLLEDAEVAAAAARDTKAVEEKEPEAEGQGEVEATAGTGTEGATTAPASETTPAKKSPKAKSKPAVKGPLVKANIYWSNDADLRWARKWTDNVEHHLGLPGHIKNHRFKTRYIFETPEEHGAANKTESTEVTKESGAEAEAEAGAEQEPEKKKGWFGWFGGKSGSSSADARA